MAIDIETLRARIKDSYKSFSSYEDAGTITSYEFGPPAIGWFKTIFRRPDNLRFEWSETEREDDKSSLIVNGAKAQLLLSGLASKLGRGRGPKIMDVITGLSKAADKTHGLTDIILSLLVENSGSSYFLNRQLKRLRDEWVDEEPCYQLQATTVYGQTRVWVSHNDYTVRRCENDGPLPIVDSFGGLAIPVKYSQVWLFRSVHFNKLSGRPATSLDQSLG
jgi:outer membrane lipoprotein-sorting protein